VNLEYLQEYEVTVKGGATGIGGNFGNISGITLDADYVWSFTTGEPKMVAYSPAPTDVTSPVVDPAAKITVEMNFRPNQATINNGISIKDSSGNNVHILMR